LSKSQKEFLLRQQVCFLRPYVPCLTNSKLHSAMLVFLDSYKYT
jgi:hypothetical protein